MLCPLVSFLFFSFFSFSFFLSLFSRWSIHHNRHQYRLQPTDFFFSIGPFSFLFITRLRDPPGVQQTGLQNYFIYVTVYVLSNEHQQIPRACLLMPGYLSNAQQLAYSQVPMPSVVAYSCTLPRPRRSARTNINSQSLERSNPVLVSCASLIKPCVTELSPKNKVNLF